MNPTSLHFAAYLADPLMAVDLDILVRAGRIQRQAQATGEDTPAGWFALAARSYGSTHPLARRACELAAASLSAEVPS